ncbi:MAG: hypothetical protein HYZ14_12790 [Bacteroidetes bacterium]|nr:hypothetical protein [Bacteroidota bacterium]
MLRNNRLIVLFSLLVLFSCKAKNTCENSDIEKFDSFLGLDAGTLEIELKNKLGDFTSGYYSEDNLRFIYNFFAVPDAPVSVVVNASSARVETVIMEVLTFKDDFKKDLEAVAVAYNIPDCDSRFFGMLKEELIAEMGEPEKEELLDGNVTSLHYFSQDRKTEVNFKFYPEQENWCSSVIVNWYH